MAFTAANLVEDSFVELNVCQPNELDPGDATYGLAKLNRILDNLNADQKAVYGEQISTFTLTPNLNPHTIGIAANTPTLTVTVNRPVSIEQANIQVGAGTSLMRYWLEKKDSQAWMNETMPNVANPIPRYFYYEPLWPNGNLYLWMVPSAAYTLEILYRVALAQLTGATTFTLPPGYRDAITLTLAEDLVVPYHVTDQGLLERLTKKARDARARVFANNQPTPLLRTADSGMPNNQGRSGWNFWTGMVEGSKLP